MYKEIGEKIKKLRKSKGITQKELGDRLGVSDSYMNHMEKGNRKISIEFLQSIADVLDVEIVYFFQDQEVVKLSEEEEALVLYHKQLSEEGITISDIKQWVEIAKNVRKNV